jgi:hypothetical protein
MPYITREDGEHFVIPSYRDVLTATSKSQLKKDILALSQNYGAYIAMQAKSATQYEVAFSPDLGYLLGESIWHHFNRPPDLIYCEALPNTTEAILVIVKAGAVYLDGSFPLESIAEELIIFLTQQNNFEIYVYGDVPISETPEPNKFSFEANSVKSFVHLEKPVFPTLPLLKAYQLQLVDPVLKAHGIGVFPVRSVVIIVAFVIAGYFVWSFLSTRKVEVIQPTQQVDVYQAFYATLMSPSPPIQINEFINKLNVLATMPGWTPLTITYTPGILEATVAPGDTIESLSEWAEKNGATVKVDADGIHVSMALELKNRMKPKKIYPLEDISAAVLDRVSVVYPGNHVKLNEFTQKGVYSTVKITITLEEVTPLVLSLIGQQLRHLPLVLTAISITGVRNGQLSGLIILEGLGS